MGKGPTVVANEFDINQNMDSFFTTYHIRSAVFGVFRLKQNAYGANIPLN